MQHNQFRRNATAFIAAVLLLAGIAPAAVGLTVRVPQDHLTLREGLLDTLLTHGDTVLVGPGTYSGPGNRDLSFEGKNLVMLSTHGADQTIIDVQGTEENNHRGFLFSGGTHGVETRDAILDGFTIQNGLMGTPPGPDKPHVASVASDRRGDRIQHDLSGAGVMIRLDASPTIRNCIIRNCASEFTGGGIGVEFGSQPLFENVVVQGCAAGIQGGGISAELLAAPTFVDCVITGNSAPNGGGIAIHEPTLLRGCVVAGNIARRGGGVDVVFPGAATLERTIVWGNCAVDSGAQLFVDPAVPMSGEVVVTCSAIDTLGIRDSGNVIQFQDSNVFVDPRFCAAAVCEEAPTTAGGYTLHADSPCLPAGNACNVLIGPNPAACSTPVEKRSLSQVKSLFR